MISFLPVVVVDGGSLLFVDLESYGIVSSYHHDTFAFTSISISVSVSFNLADTQSSIYLPSQFIDHGSWIMDFQL